LITVVDVSFSTGIVIAAFVAVVALSFRPSTHTDLFPVSVTQELKGLGILTIVFAHISYMLVTDNTFLYPLSIAAGVGVDLFLFMSGYGLTVGMLKKPLPITDFYQRRLIKVFIPFWIVLIILFLSDGFIRDIHYSPIYIVQSFLGWFPRANAYVDVNSPFWYISWMLMFYILFPVLFMRNRPWLTALLLACIANALALLNPLQLQVNWLHRLHTNAFSLGILLAWWLQSHPQQTQWLVQFRNQPRYTRIRCLLIFTTLIAAGYMAYHSSADNWPTISKLLETTGFDAKFFVGQASSLLTMFALIICFSLKHFDNKFLYWYGVFSYETYLLHWPLMARYDIFFHHLPAWAATIIWIAAFLGIGWCLQKVTTPVGAWVDRLR
jgi:peptidoglycan/LPS O-acetylase OafA/YrhL